MSLLVGEYTYIDKKDSLKLTVRAHISFSYRLIRNDYIIGSFERGIALKSGYIW